MLFGVTANVRSSPVIVQANKCVRRLKDRLLPFSAALIRDCQYSELAQWGNPHDAEIQRIGPLVRKYGSAGPVLREDAPTECIIVTEWRHVQSLVRFSLEQRSVATFTAQLIGDELRIISDRAVHRACGSHHFRIVDCWAVRRHWPTVLPVWPWLINFARCANTAKSATRHSKRLEHHFAHQVFPGPSSNSLGDRTRESIAKV